MADDFEEILALTRKGLSKHKVEVEECGIMKVRRNPNDGWSNVDPTLRIDTNLRRVILHDQRYAGLARSISETLTERYGDYELLHKIVDDPIDNL